MPTLEELEAKLGALEAQNAMLSRRLTELEESVDGHVGIDYGAAQQLSPHPNQQIQTAEYGGGVMRLDSHGIQINAPVLTGSVFWVPSLSDSPTAPWSYITGAVTSNTSTIALKAQFSSTDSAIQLDSGFQDRVLIYTESATQFAQVALDVLHEKVAISKVLYFYSLTSDPSTLLDGMMWYRSDLGTFRVRQAGLTKTITVV